MTDQHTRPTHLALIRPGQDNPAPRPARGLYPDPRPFTGDPFDAEPDTEHPSPDGSYVVDRLVVERHLHQMLHDASDGYDHVPVTAVYWPSIGEYVELGPWSMSPSDARTLAASLVALANLVDTRHPDSLIQDATA